MSILRKNLTFGFEQTFTVPNWWTEEGFTHVSDTPLKREKMLDLAKALDEVQGGFYKESKDIWDNLQYETFDKDGKDSFIVTMDPGSIEVKTQPSVFADLEEMAKPLMIAADQVELVPYRNWWYGVKGHTEGGCHVNMGGISKESNPFYNDPILIVKYCAYIHNHPWLHYPFMGPDVGPGGNAMRLDERDDFELTKKLFASYEEMDADKTYEHFKECSLIKHKDGFPCLKKFTAPLYLIEDRAQEALRSAEDFKLVSEMRLKILEYLQTRNDVEKLNTFKHIHTQFLTSFFLWDHFKGWAQEVHLDPAPYMRFFERQFPVLNGGENKPKDIQIKEGRRPRKILSEDVVDGVARSKKIDTTYKRLEFFHESKEECVVKFKLNARGIEVQSDVYKSKQDDKIIHYFYLDLKYDPQKPEISISLSVDGDEKESAKFNVNDMTWC